MCVCVCVCVCEYACFCVARQHRHLSQHRIQRLLPGKGWLGGSSGGGMCVCVCVCVCACVCRYSDWLRMRRCLWLCLRGWWYGCEYDYMVGCDCDFMVAGVIIWLRDEYISPIHFNTSSPASPLSRIRLASLLPSIPPPAWVGQQQCVCVCVCVCV